MTDQLLFLNAQGRRLWIAGWTGPWPPPEQLVVAKGQRTGMVSILAADESIERMDPLKLAALNAAVELGTITFMPFRLRNASAIVEPAPEDAHWFRGAEYVPEGDDA